MRRVVETEILDTLPFDDPEALRNRRELRLFNALMGNYRWLERRARPLLRKGARVLELGAGSGDLARRLRRRELGARLDGLDLCPAPADWPAGARWWREDLRFFDGYGDYDVVIANLILHQFKPEELAEVGRRIDEGARFLFASEPARRRRHLLQLAGLSVCGLGSVSRHDAAVSIRAGFVGEELPELLGLSPEAWAWRCRVGWRGQYFMEARRREL